LIKAIELIEQHREEMQQRDLEREEKFKLLAAKKEQNLKK